MPWLPLVAAIVGMAGTGISIGEQLANQPGSPKMPTPTAPTPPTPTQQRTSMAQIAQESNPFALNTLSAAPGVSPEYAAMSGLFGSGNAGMPGAAGAAQLAIQNAFGGGSAFGSPNLPGTPTANFMPAGSGANPSTAAGAFPTSPVSLSDFVNSYIRG